jgi:hypothetical protein
MKTILLRDKREILYCLDCGRDWDTVKHTSNGFCRGCNRKKQSKEALEKRENTTRAIIVILKDGTKLTNCIDCRRSWNQVTHNANGLCRCCYQRKIKEKQESKKTGETL